MGLLALGRPHGNAVLAVIVDHAVVVVPENKPGERRL